MDIDNMSTKELRNLRNQIDAEIIRKIQEQNSKKNIKEQPELFDLEKAAEEWLKNRRR